MEEKEVLRECDKSTIYKNWQIEKVVEELLQLCDKRTLYENWQKERPTGRKVKERQRRVITNARKKYPLRELAKRAALDCQTHQGKSSASEG